MFQESVVSKHYNLCYKEILQCHVLGSTTVYHVFEFAIEFKNKLKLMHIIEINLIMIIKYSKIFYGRDLRREEFPATYCWANYQPLSVINK